MFLNGRRDQVKSSARKTSKGFRNVGHFVKPYGEVFEIGGDGMIHKTEELRGSIGSPFVSLYPCKGKETGGPCSETIQNCQPVLNDCSVESL